MSLIGELAAVRKHVLIELEKGLGRIFGFTILSSTSSMGDTDAAETSDEAPGGQRPVQRLEPFGFRNRPPTGVRGFWFRLGSSNVAYIGILPTEAYGPNDLDVGESAQYCSAGGTVVKLDKNGNILITAASGSNVTVNGGSLDVARVTDTVAAAVSTPPVTTDMLAWIATVTAALNFAGPIVGPAGIVPPTNFGVINSGAAHFKG